MRSVGKRIKRLREAQGLSQRSLACPGITPAYVSRIEKGERTPSLTTLRKLAQRLGVTPLYLETGRENATCPHCHRHPNEGSNGA